MPSWGSYRPMKQPPPEVLQGGRLCRAMDVSSAMAGKIVQELIPVSPINRKGYPSDVIYKFINGQEG